MRILQDFRRVSKRHRCPVCSRPDWCLVDAADPANPSRVICKRVQSEREWGEAGWLHALRDVRHPTIARRKYEWVAGPDFSELAQRHRRQVSPDALEQFSRDLGVSSEALNELGIGQVRDGWSFPMFDANRRTVGIRLRLIDGRRLAVKGSRDGLFLAATVAITNRVFVAEGPTDTAALNALKLPAIGRPSCRGGTKHLIQVARSARPKLLVVVSDNDAPGKDGALRLAQALRPIVPDVRLIAPPATFKDVREWVLSGATLGEIERAVDVASPIAFEINEGRQIR